MIGVLLGIVAAAGIGAVIEGYLIMGQNQWLKNHAEADRDDRAQMLDAFRRLLMETPTPDELEPVEDVEPAPRYPRLRAAAAKVNARMQPTFLEPEQPVTEPHRVIRPSPVPREPAPHPDPTVPMERAWEESAAELTEHDKWQADQDAKHAEFMAWLDGVAPKGVA